MEFLIALRWWIKEKMDNLIFQDKCETFTINLEYNAYEQMLQYCVKSNPNETGGILIGNYSTNQGIANIIQTPPPPLNSKHAKYNFSRGTKGLKETLDIAWKNGQYYLGEWHYHPNAPADPSYTDIKQMITFSNDKKLKCPEPILLIIGGNLNNWKISISIFSNKERTILECKR